MAIVGNELDQFEYIIFIIIIVLSGICFLYQVMFLQKTKISPALLLPLLSFCICYENIVLIFGDSVNSESKTAYFAYIFHSFQIPLFILILFETSYRLHEVRSAHFFCLPFDQGQD